MSKFLSKPPSVRSAAAVIVTATTLVVIGGGILIRVLDHHEYANIWVGMWWSLQTVTTVGYGDVTPKQPIGRVVGAFVMLEGIAFLAIITLLAMALCERGVPARSFTGSQVRVRTTNAHRRARITDIETQRPH